MRCERIFEIISAYADTEANALELLAMQEHIKGCPVCKNEISAQYALKDLILSGKTAVKAPDLSSRIMQSVKALEQDKAAAACAVREQAPFRIWAVGAMAAVVFLAAFVGVNINYTNSPVNTISDTGSNYASYIYEHLNDSELAFTSISPQVKQVNFIQ